MTRPTIFALALIAAAVSTSASAETRLDTTDNTSWRHSRTAMAVECDGQPRGPCFMELLKGADAIRKDFFAKHMNGLTADDYKKTPGLSLVDSEFFKRQKEVEVLYKTYMHNITLAQFKARIAAAK